MPRRTKTTSELIDQILAKARLRKGLSHREAAVLLDCEIPEKVEEIFELARRDQGRISTETGSSCLRRCICRITASMAACTVHTT